MNHQTKRDEEVFVDYKAQLTEGQARIEANRCLYCSDAPCIQACPTEINIPEFIRKIATGNDKGSAKTIFDSNILGTSCARVCPVEVLCVGDCVYNHMGVAPIQIGQLQRYATDKALEQEWKYYKAGPDKGKHVALVGAGPASLAAAHELRILGYACTLIDKRSHIGGLNVTGVAPYKMKARDGEKEAAWILDIGGINVQTNQSIGKDQDISWQTLENEYDAIFIGFGLGADSRLTAQGESLDGVWGAVDFIEQFKLSQIDLSQVKHATVVGGGNTAIDAVRELKGLGVPQVSLVYRRDEASMSGYIHEWKAAKVEGVSAYWRTQPLAFEGNDGKVNALSCVRLDENRQAIEGSNYQIETELVLLAIGQSKQGELLSDLTDITVQWGKIEVDEQGRTGRSGYFAGGDCSNGGKEVVNAAAEGKKAAHAIHEYLTQGHSLKGDQHG
jgi:dihydropyrimidine dehydrogenase (NAD+) subunit PreT